MGAPTGNQFWKLRSKHGREKLFATPEMFWEACCEYFETCDENPFHKSEAKTVNIGDYQSQVEIVNLPVMRPYTFQGLCRYLNAHSTYFNEFEESLKGKEDQLSKDFSQTLARVRDIIFEQKFSGAASGFFNATIVSRDLGLKDASAIEHKGLPNGPMQVEIVRSDDTEA